MTMPPAAHAGEAVRAMTLADIEQVHLIEIGAYSYPWSRGNFVDSLAANHDARVLLDGQGAVIGYSIVMEGVDEEHLLNLTVARQVQRCGWGRSLLRGVIAAARARGAGSLWLEVRASNTPALALYEQAGFVQTGLRRAYYPARSGREDAVLMSLTLASAELESH